MPVLKIAAVVHLFYNEQWQELATYLRNIHQEFSLFVTVPDFSEASGFVLRDFPAAQVVRVPNVGRDVAPFIRLLPDLQRFDVVCKIHTKRNIGTSDLWRKELLRGVLGSRQIVNLILRAFDSHPDMVLAGPKPLYLDGPTYMFGSRPLMEKYFGALPARFGFFGGTMFWVRPSMLADFPNLFSMDDFVPHDEDDCHPEHAFERLIGARAAVTVGATIALVGENWLRQPRIEILPATAAGQKNLSLTSGALARTRRIPGKLLAPLKRSPR